MNPLELITSGEALSPAQAARVARALLDDDTPLSIVAAALAAMRARGETGEELLGFARVLLEAARLVPAAPRGAVDNCGTGGDGAGTFNISTAAAIVAAACGVPVVKHGNGSVTSRSGSADVTRALGLPFTEPGAGLDARLAFLFAPDFHPVLARVGGVRRELGIRTIFNLVGPLANPARPEFRVVGVGTRERLPDVARALQGLGCRRAFVVHGEPGVDEATPAGRFTVVDVTPDAIIAADYTAADFGLPACALADIRGGDADENAHIIERILAGEFGAPRDTVVLNAALVLLVTGRARRPREAAEIAGQAIASGNARRLLNELRRPVHA